MTRKVGIEKLRVYPSTLSLDMGALCAARDHDPADVHDNLMVDRRAVNPPWEDAVTMAVNAAAPMLSGEDRAAIQLVIVGSETSVDQEKPISSWVHRYLGIQPHCRNFEIKHACYSGTAGVQMATSWLASGQAPPGAKALVINSDQSLISIGEPYEYICGAGAAALLLSSSDEPDFLEFELGKSGVYANEVTDVFRPTPRVETGNSETSLYSYLDALAGAYARYAEVVGNVDFDAFFQRNVYHVPFGGMSFRAHKALLQEHTPITSKADVRAHWERKVRASLHYTRQIGGVYGSSTFLALLGLVEATEDLVAGERVGIFAYGSGSCAEFYSARIGTRAKAVARAADLQSLCDARRAITVAEYEAIERERDEHTGARDFVARAGCAGHLYEELYAGKRQLVLQKVDGYYRHYEWS